MTQEMPKSSQEDTNPGSKSVHVRQCTINGVSVYLSEDRAIFSRERVCQYAQKDPNYPVSITILARKGMSGPWTIKGSDMMLFPGDRVTVRYEGCCDWPHVRPCGPTRDDTTCACGCTAFDERCQ